MANPAEGQKTSNGLSMWQSLYSVDSLLIGPDFTPDIWNLEQSGMWTHYAKGTTREVDKKMLVLIPVTRFSFPLRRRPRERARILALERGNMRATTAVWQEQCTTLNSTVPSSPSHPAPGSVQDKLLKTVNFLDITHDSKIHTCFKLWRHKFVGKKFPPQTLAVE